VFDDVVVPTSDGRDLGVAQWGDPEGTPLFWLHGTPGSRFLRHVGGEYERNGIRAITYDRPGYGRSTRAQGRRVADSAGDIVTIADALDIDRFAIVGVSGGGPHALAMAAGHPERVMRCATIVGVAPRDAEDLDYFAGMSQEEIDETEQMAGADDSTSGQVYLDTVAWVESLGQSDDLPPHLRGMVVQTVREGLVQGPGGMLDDYAMGAQAWGFDIADVRCETRVMVAREDSSVPPAHGYWLVSHLKRAELVLVDGGHLGPREEAEEQLLRWLVGRETDG
jgi:pimeloyl-ACP methyl ester carboxylesterase